MQKRNTELGAILVDRLETLIHGGYVSLDTVADFCQVTTGTLAGWFSTRRPFGGFTTLRLWHLVAVAGVESPELDRLQQQYPLNWYIGRLLAFSVITYEEAKDYFGVKKDENAVLQYTAGKRNPVAPTVTLEDLQECYEAELQQAINSLLGQMTQPQAASQPTDHTQQSGHTQSAVRTELVLQVAQAILNALPSINFAVEHFTPEERDQLRKAIGAENVFQLSNGFTRICGERAGGY